jgi:type II secretory pathway pseudopilin PulG
MQPERHIEKLLRAFAKKRRADAADAFKLHPVTRRQLQNEVSRQFAEDPEPEESVSLWQFFRQQWAFLFLFVFILFFSASLLVPTLSRAKMKSRQVAAASQLKEIGAAAQIAAADNNGRLPATLDALTNGLVAGRTLLDPLSGKPFVYIAGGETLDNLQSNSVLAYSPEDKKGRALLLADGTVEVVNSKLFNEVLQRGLIQHVPAVEVAANAPAPATPPAPSASPAAGGTLAVASGFAADRLELDISATSPATTGTFAVNGTRASGTGGGGGGAGGDSFGLGTTSDSEIAGKETARALAAKGIPSAGIVAAARPQPTFRFKTIAPEISAKPGESSDAVFYKLSAPATAQSASVLANFEVRLDANTLTIVDADGSVYTGLFKTQTAIAQTIAPTAKPSPVEKAGDADLTKTEKTRRPIAGNYFRVTGQNQTTKQNVVFTGEIIPASGTNAAASAALFNNARITGTVTLNETNRIEINAVPATP